MALPAAPTVTTLAQEALKKAGYVVVDTVVQARAETEWAEEIKNDIFTFLKDATPLQNQKVLILRKGVKKYTLPDDYMSEMTMKLLDGNEKDTAQSGSTSTIQLAAAATGGEGYYVGKEVMIVENTGIGSFSQISAYNESTKTANVDPDFATAPDSTSVYRIITNYTLLNPVMRWEIDNISSQTVTSIPTHYSVIGDPDYGEFILYPVPNDTMGLLLSYGVDLSRVDLTSTLMTTLYRRFRNLWIKGFMYKAWEDMDDERYIRAMNEYKAQLLALRISETYGHDISDLQTRVIDY